MIFLPCDRAKTSLEYIERFHVPNESTISFITRDIGNNGFFVVYKDYKYKTRHVYVYKRDIIEYMRKPQFFLAGDTAVAERG